jgi:putative ABC transport system permease protein
MDKVLTDLSQAMASVRRQPTFLVAAVVTLAIGIGGTTAVFSLLSGVVLEPLPYGNPEQLVRLTCPAGSGFFSRPDFLDIREQATSFREVASFIDYSIQGFDLTGAGPARRVAAMPVSSDYFETLGYEVFLGRQFTRNDELEETRRVIVSHRLWSEHFGGDPAAIGGNVMLDREPWTVVAVAPPEFREPYGRKIDVWPVDDLSPVAAERQNYYLSVIGRLQEGSTIAEAQTEIDAIVARIDAENPGRNPWQIRLEPLHDAVLGGGKILLLVLFGAMTLVMVIACVNVANLTLARSINRQRELAVRSALGGSRPRLAGLLLAESGIVAVAGGFFGLGLAWLAIEGLRSLRPTAVPRLDAVTIDGHVFLFAAIASMLTAVLFGLVPALRVSGASVGNVLRTVRRGATANLSSRRLRRVLVVAEISLAFILVVGAALLAQSVGNLLGVETGFSHDKVHTFQLSLPTSEYPVEDPTARIELDRQLHRRLSTLPGVSSAGSVSRLPLTGTYYSWMYVIRSESEAAGESVYHLANTRVVSGDYFTALGVKLLRGRQFGVADDFDSTRVAIVNRELVERRFANSEPLGKWVGNGEEWRQIVGVVENERIGLREDNPERIYYPYSQWASEGNWEMTWVVAGKDGSTPDMAQIQKVVENVDPQLVPFNQGLLEGVVAAALEREHFAMMLLTGFAIAALVLAAIGIYGVLSYSVAQRMPEIGLRLALGAQPRQVSRSVFREAIHMTVAALVLGVAGAVVLTRWLESLIFGVSLTDPPTFFVMGVLVLLIAVTASLVPARRAASADLPSLLRME